MFCLSNPNHHLPQSVVPAVPTQHISQHHRLGHTSQVWVYHQFILVVFTLLQARNKATILYETPTERLAQLNIAKKVGLVTEVKGQPCGLYNVVH